MAARRRVFIVNAYGVEYTRMFSDHGWVRIFNFKDADLIQFVGGADVSPSLYGQHIHPKTRTSPRRDKIEKMFFLAALKHKIPMAGICRGGQFLNVMCGGQLWQHVEGHTGRHNAIFTDSKKEHQIIVTSTHHQMMIPKNKPKDLMVLMVANMGMRKEKYTSLIATKKMITIKAKNKDVEALYYIENKCLCFQPHPEFTHEKKLAKIYFSFIDMYLIR